MSGSKELERNLTYSLSQAFVGCCFQAELNYVCFHLVLILNQNYSTVNGSSLYYAIAFYILLAPEILYRNLTLRFGHIVYVGSTKFELYQIIYEIALISYSDPLS